MRCVEQLVEALVACIVASARQTDQVIQQREYWKGVADRIYNIVMSEEVS